MNRYTIAPPQPMGPRAYIEWVNTLPFVWPADGPRLLFIAPFERFVETTATIAGYPVTVVAPGERPDMWIITRYAMRKRLTLNERADIEVASMDNPSGTAAARLRAARLRTFMADMMSTAKVNLKDPIIVAGFEQMETLGLIAAGRAAQITNTEPTEDERTGGS